MYRTFIIAGLLLSIVLSVVLSPDVALEASLSGLTIWWKLVFPGLLPFLILYELILAFGLVHGIQALLSPFTTRLLKMPRAASLPFIMSLLSGFPAGVEPTLQLLQDKQLSKQQAQRLLGYMHFPNPIFVTVIIGAGFFHTPILGLIIISTIWISAIILMTLHSYVATRKSNDLDLTDNHSHINFVASMELGRKLDGRGLGKVLGDSVAASVQKLFVIGGFIIFSSVIAAFATSLLNNFTLQLPFLAHALLELHIGSYAISVWTMGQNSIILGCALLVACLSFSGISGILQVSFYTTGQPIRTLLFIKYRIFHAICGFFMTYILWKPLSWAFSKWLHIEYQTVFSTSAGNYSPASYQAQQLPFIWKESIIMCLVFIIFITLITVVQKLRLKDQLF
ncbi:hypothetical protein [Paenibacillus endoradicis]|uniref:hypothetical protein n=1 Tax=Paenibacillus endoradicis TaxID=2972487 RepID=UPI002159895B|nr:hypothetical protein [Paenibacillus endoradicis]MCR8656185.1 hypothetical protein [Paenibacillus endoradicis]